MSKKGSSPSRGSSGSRARSAITGRFVTPKTAARHPRTTVVETVKSTGSGKNKK